MVCPKCSGIVQSRGRKKNRHEYWCISDKCKKNHTWRGWFSVPVDEFEHIEDVSILTIDIETAPMLVWNWGLSTPMKRLGLDNIYQEWFVLSWAAKWHGKKKIISRCVTPKEAKTQNDERIVRDLWELLEQPTAVVTHNGRFFDIPKIEDRYLTWGLGPNLPYKSIDTYSIARRLSPTSRKLDYIAQRHLGNTKFDTEFQLWVDCTLGDKRALKRMLAYNEQDVLVGEEVYDFLRVWDRSPLNMGLFNNHDKPVCRSCGSKEIKIVNKSYATPQNLLPVYRCNNCEYCGRMKTSKLTTDQRRNLTN